jgi:dihydroorotase
MNKFAIKNACIVNEGKSFNGTVFISNDIIERITQDEYPDTFGYVVIDGTGKHLLPGVIDTHVHFRDPGLTHKGDMISESRAAVAGGVTSIVDMSNTIPQTTNIQYFNDKCRRAEEVCIVNFSFYLGATNENLDELLHADLSRVFGVKLFMGSSTGNMLVNNEKTLEDIFKNVRLPIVAHCEDESRIKNNILKIKQQYGGQPPVSVHPLIRDDEACFRSSEKAVNLATKYNTRLHLAHLSSRKELSLLRNDIPLTEKKITSEVCVHHLWFSDDDYAEKGAQIKCNPSIKSLSDRDSLRNALKNNLLDSIATDHAPHTWEEKQQPYFESPSGIPLIQHALPAMLEMVRQGIFTIEQTVEKMCHHPALLFQIEKRGFIREGYFADLVLLDLNDKLKVEPENILYKCKWSPFQGVTFNSNILMTFVNGYPVWDNGKINDFQKGKQLEFK